MSVMTLIAYIVASVFLVSFLVLFVAEAIRTSGPRNRRNDDMPLVASIVVMSAAITLSVLTLYLTVRYGLPTIYSIVSMQIPIEG